MIKLFLDYLYAQPNLTAGIDDAFISTQASVPVFVPMILFFIWSVVVVGGGTAQKNRTGAFDFPMWVAIGSISTLMVALPMTLVAGLVGLNVLVILVVVTIFSGFWLFMDRRKTEVY